LPQKSMDTAILTVVTGWRVSNNEETLKTQLACLGNLYRFFLQVYYPRLDKKKLCHIYFILRGFLLCSPCLNFNENLRSGDEISNIIWLLNSPNLLNNFYESQNIFYSLSCPLRFQSCTQCS
jgi:hypothetical protein